MDFDSDESDFDSDGSINIDGVDDLGIVKDF